jgi:hypothetical protein
MRPQAPLSFIGGPGTASCMQPGCAAALGCEGTLASDPAAVLLHPHKQRHAIDFSCWPMLCDMIITLHKLPRVAQMS